MGTLFLNGNGVLFSPRSLLPQVLIRIRRFTKPPCAFELVPPWALPALSKSLDEPDNEVVADETHDRRSQQNPNPSHSVLPFFP